MLRELAEAIAAYFEAVGIRTKIVGEEQAANRAGKGQPDRNQDRRSLYLGGPAEEPVRWIRARVSTCTSRKMEDLAFISTRRLKR